MSVVQLERAMETADAQLRASNVEQSRTLDSSNDRESNRTRRPRVQGKFLYIGDEHFWIRGVTYGTFRPDPAGLQFPNKETVERDLRSIAEAGLNSVRVYTPPPRWLLDAAGACGVKVMIGLPWEQHIAFLDDGTRTKRIIRDMRASVRNLAGHPAVLCYAVGNEIPPSVVRWYGKSRVERFIEKLCREVKSVDPCALTTYVNFPTTEYLNLPFLDFLAFNVYLETRETLTSYLGRLQNLAGERPLVMAEVGLDSRRNGEVVQAESLDWQIATAFEAGCAGAFVFAWTDEWFRGGQDIDDWDFGLTTRSRQPKAALQAVSARFAKVPFAIDDRWPKVSVIVCSYNGARTIGETLAALGKLEYPNYEIIVVNDGSTDQTRAIANRHDVQLICTENNGLSAARNQGMNAAKGEIIAYIDDDAFPDAHWLTYLVSCFQRAEHAGIGGPNLAPPKDGAIAACVANAPGGPRHVLLSDEIAEHVPGCNMAYRRDHLLAIGGFDPRFRVAGDDVDICWRLQEQGWTIGFTPTAIVWHHRRNLIKTYFKQQWGYAKAEALLADKWPAKYNSAGHLTWEGRLYGPGVVATLFQRCRIYHGKWGSAPFQSVYESSPGHWRSLTLMPEWYFVLLSLVSLSALGASWGPLLWLAPIAAASVSLTVLQAGINGYRASFNPRPRSRLRRVAMHLLVAFLHLAQPAARLLGRIQQQIGPWEWKTPARVTPLPIVISLWSIRWEPLESHLLNLESILKGTRTVVIPGSEFDSWDLAIRGGFFGIIRVIAMVEEHGDAKQLFRFRAWPKAPVIVIAAFFAIIAAAGLALLDGAPVAAMLLALAGGTVGLFVYSDCAFAMSRFCDAVNKYLHRETSLCIIPSDRFSGLQVTSSLRAIARRLLG
jgi:O-antigen biosynthesis protein